MNTFNWDVLLKRRSLNRVKRFAVGELSGRGLYNQFVGTDLGGEVRLLTRRGNVTRNRALARKALRRRGVSV